LRLYPHYTRCAEAFSVTGSRDVGACETLSAFVHIKREAAADVPGIFNGSGGGRAQQWLSIAPPACVCWRRDPACAVHAAGGAQNPAGTGGPPAAGLRPRILAMLRLYRRGFKDTALAFDRRLPLE
jgi:hypothetical protein